MTLRDKLKFWILLSSYVEMIVRGTSPLLLPNAIADSLEYLKAFGGTKQGLPDGYTQVEYLQSTGTQYIDTGYYPNQNTKFEISGTQANADSALFGLSAVFYCFDNGRDATFYGFCGNTGSFNFAIGGTPVVLTMSASDGIVINGTKYADLTAGSTTANYSMALFGRMNNATGVVEKLGAHKINYAKIYDNNVLVRNFIPAKRNSDNVVGMYDTVSQTFFTNAGTGTFTAGGEAVPTPDTPMDIISNNGALKVFAGNKFTTDGATAGYIIGTSTGEISPNENYVVTDYIYLLAGTYTGTFFESPAGNKFFRAWSYNADDGTPIQEIFNKRATGDLETFNFSISENCYIRVSYRNSFTQMTISPTSPIIYADGTVETINVHGKNLFDITSLTRNAGYMVSTVNGLFVGSDQYTRSDYMPCLPNTQYTRTASGAASTVFYDRNKNFLSARTGIPFTTPDDCHYIIYNVRNNVDYSQGMMVKGDELPTTYQPYFDGGTATAEMLLKVGNYQDVQEILSGAITRNVGVKVLDGTENWQSNVTSKFYLIDNVMKAQDNSPTLCSHYKSILAASTAAVGNGQIALFVGGGARLVVGDNNYTTISGFKQFLADQYANGTPVTIIYPLATPTTETVTGQTMQVQQGDNVVEITQASLDNLEIEAKFKKQA